MKKINQQTSDFKSENQVINLNSVKFEEEVKICPLCGKPYKGWGNNPYPLNVGKVCDKCNLNVIIPMRIIMNRNKSNQKSEEI